MNEAESNPLAKLNDLDWLVGHRLHEAIRHEFSWSLVVDHSVSVSVQCIWRLVENGRIRMTSEDDGHQFGLPAPKDAILVLSKTIVGATITSVVLRSGTLDLDLHFDSGHIFQVIPDSSGYESWIVNQPSRQFIAVGGGDLVVLPN